MAGTAPGSVASVNETTTTLPLLETPGQYADYVTSTVFGAVSASGVTLGGGLTNGSVVIYGIQAASRMLLGESKLTDKQTNVSPAIQHGYNVKDRYNIATTQDPEWEFSGPLFANNAHLWLQCAYSSNLTYTTAPASATVLLAASSVATSGTPSLTTQPTAPGMILALVLGGTAPATAASVSVTGTNPAGEAITEVVIATTKTQGTYYSKNVFTTVTASGIANGAFGTGATLAVNGIFSVNATTATPLTDSRQSFVLENYDSTASKVAAGCLVDEWSIEGGMNAEAKVMAKGKCQYIGLVGNLATATNQVTAPAQEPEEALTGWEALIYIDPASNSFGTTLSNDVVTYKVDFKPNWKTRHASGWNPPYRAWTKAYVNYGEADAEFTLDMTNTTYQNEYDAYKKGRKRLVQLWCAGPARLRHGQLDDLLCRLQTQPDPLLDRRPRSRLLQRQRERRDQLKAKCFIDPTFAYAWNSPGPISSPTAGPESRFVRRRFMAPPPAHISPCPNHHISASRSIPCLLSIAPRMSARPKTCTPTGGASSAPATARPMAKQSPIPTSRDATSNAPSSTTPTWAATPARSVARSCANST